MPQALIIGPVEDGMHSCCLLPVSSRQCIAVNPVVKLSLEYLYVDCLLPDVRPPPHYQFSSSFAVDSLSLSLTNQYHVTVCLDSQRSLDMEHGCSDSVPGTAAEQRARYSPQLHIRTACQLVHRLNTHSSCYLGENIVNDDFSRNAVRGSLSQAPSTARLLGGIFQNVRSSTQRRCQTCLTTSGRNFEHLL